MADVSNPEIEELYNEVFSGKTETSWFILKYEDPKSNVLVVDCKGEGNGLEEIKAHLQEDQCQYCYVRLTTGDEESRRTKFIFITWVGERVSPLKRAKISVHKADVKAVIKVYSCEFHFTTVEDINEEEILNAVVKAGGANYSANT